GAQVKFFRQRSPGSGRRLGRGLRPGRLEINACQEESGEEKGRESLGHCNNTLRSNRTESDRHATAVYRPPATGMLILRDTRAARPTFSGILGPTAAARRESATPAVASGRRAL